MKLGTETGSMINHLYSRMTKGAPEPYVGMPATVCHWTDRNAAYVGAVFEYRGATMVSLSPCKATVIAGSTFDGSAGYEYSPFDPAAPIGKTFRRLPSGKWEKVIPGERAGTWKKSPGPGLILGFHDEYYDPSF